MRIIRMEKDFFNPDNLVDPFSVFSNLQQQKLSDPRPTGRMMGAQSVPFLSSFLVDLVHCLKGSLNSIRNFTLLSMDKFNDPEFRKYAYRNVADDIKKVDSVLNILLNYVSINTPVIKSNTVHLILESILEANDKQFKERNIRILKKFDKSLPEISMHDEQMRFIFDSLLQYALLSTPNNGTIGFLIKTLDSSKEGEDRKAPPEKKAGAIVVVVGFIKEKRRAETIGGVSRIVTGQKQDAMNLILHLVKEIVQNNRGTMEIKTDEKKDKTLITLTLPVERRKIIYYEPISF